MNEVRVYRNLHRNLLSVQERTARGWRVARHTDRIVLKNARFTVSAAGRRRVLDEHRKNVHAFAIGEPVDAGTEWFIENPRRVTYNPYKYETFVDDTGNPVDTAAWAVVTTKGITATQGNGG
jgi:hypothetical protein